MTSESKIEPVADKRAPYRLDGIIINGEMFWFDSYTPRKKGGTYINFIDVGYWGRNEHHKWPINTPEDVDRMVRCILTAIVEGKLCKQQT